MFINLLPQNAGDHRYMNSFAFLFFLQNFFLMYCFVTVMYTCVSSVVFSVFLKAKLGIQQVFTQTKRKCRQDDCVFVTLCD